MGKIRITESELKDIVRESVVDVLNEVRVNYGMEWDKLSPEEQQAAAKRYYAGFHNVQVNGYKYPDGTTGTTYMDGATPVYDMDKVKNIYNRKRNRKERKGNLTYSSDQLNRTVKDIQDTSKAESDKAIANLQGQIAGWKDKYNKKVGELATIAKKLGVSYGATATKLEESAEYQNIGLNAILGAIDKLIQQKDQLAKANQQLNTRVSNQANAIKTPQNNLASTAATQKIEQPQLSRPQSTPNKAPATIPNPNRPTAFPGQTPGTSLAQK